MIFPSSPVALLQELVRIPSVNPSGDPGTTQVGEQACAEYVGALLRELGATVTFTEVEPGRPNVLGVFPSAHPSVKPNPRRLLLAPHLDTVSISGMTIDPFGGELRDGRIYGRGASDTKGTMAAMLWALRELRDELSQLPCEITFAGLMSEESGQFGSKACAEALSAADPDAPANIFVVVGEPTGLDIVHTHKGSIWATLRAEGKAVHSSQPDRGDNAITKMLPALRYFHEAGAARHLQAEDAVLGRSTVSIGTIRGGTKINIVPDLCEAEVDLRLVPGVHVAATKTALERDLATVAPGVRVTFTSAEPLRTDPTHPFIRRLENLGAKCIGAPWFCDAAIFASHGIPAVAIGPGSIAQAHTKDEWLAVDDLLAGAEFYARFLRAL